VEAVTWQDFWRATVLATTLALLIGGSQVSSCAQDVSDSRLPVSGRRRPVPPQTPNIPEDGTWLGALTRLKCSRIALLPSNSKISLSNKKLRIEVIEFHHKRHEPSVLLIATRLQEQRRMDKGARASLAGLRPGRYVIKVRWSKKEAVGTVDVPKEAENHADELLVSEADGYWAIGASAEKRE
jgi:hypothetical protein